MKILIALSIPFLLTYSAIGQEYADSSKTIKVKHSVFANIFTCGYYSFGDNYESKVGFNLATGLLGYMAEWGDKAKATIIYDVSKTTGDIFVFVDAEPPIQTNTTVLWYQGSDYTAFLKQAEIDFTPKPWLEISVGELLSQQYLTFQDKFWGFRYISTTFQELNRFGYPADYGLRVTYKMKDKLNFSIGAVNGEGPFRKQDNDATLQYFVNAEISPVKGLTLKVFGDYLWAKDKDSRSTLSYFAGYRCDKWRLGVEYNNLNNADHIDSHDYTGTSIYGAYKLADKWSVLARWDNLMKTSVYDNDHYFIAGCEYEPYKGLFISVNGRFITYGDLPMAYLNFGAKF